MKVMTSPRSWVPGWVRLAPARTEADRRWRFWLRAQRFTVKLQSEELPEKIFLAAINADAPDDRTTADEAMERAWRNYWGEAPWDESDMEDFAHAWHAATERAAGIAEAWDHGHNSSTCKHIAAAIRKGE